MPDQVLWQVKVTEPNYVEMEAEDGHIEVTGMAPGHDAVDLPDAIREPAYRFLQVPRNEGAALLEHARQHALGACITPEFYVDYDGITFCGQGFAKALVYAVKGQWGTISHVAW